MKKNLIFVVLAMFCILSVSQVLAIPGAPHQFKGIVTNNGNPAPDSFLITAEINGVEVGATSPIDGKYGYLPELFYVQDPDNNREGKTIEFFVEGIKAAEYVFSNGHSTTLDLAISSQICGDGHCTGSESCSSCPTDCGQCQTSSPVFSKGGGSPVFSKGGGGSLTKMQCEDGIDNDNDGKIDMEDPGCQADWDNTEDSDGTGVEEPEPETTACVPDWVCSEWLDCVNGIEKRVCVDSNKCGIDEGRPTEEQSCVTTEEVLLAEGATEQEIVAGTADKGNFLTRITGAVTGGGAATWIVGIVVVVVVVGLILFATRKKKAE